MAMCMQNCREKKKEERKKPTNLGQNPTQATSQWFYSTLPSPSDTPAPHLHGHDLTSHKNTIVTRTRFLSILPTATKLLLAYTHNAMYTQKKKRKENKKRSTTTAMYACKCSEYVGYRSAWRWWPAARWRRCRGC